MMNIAVLIPTYRPGCYFRDCLYSLANQTLRKTNFCVYICLNGDRDPYYEFIESILDELNVSHRLIYIEKSGVSNARNILLEIFSEDYFIFMDDDDLVSYNYLEELFYVTTSEKMGIAKVYNFIKSIDEKNPNYIGRAFDAIHDNETCKYKIRSFFSSPMGKMLHRDMIGGTRFDLSLGKGEDSLFMATISPNIRSVAKSSNDACYHVRERIGSVTRRRINPSQELKTILYLIVQYAKLLADNRYNSIFILTRIVATAIKVLGVLRPKY
jgi:glycosyltransferase involved in cell wall biosynthesis